jgi:hypothetical protein
MPRPSPQPTSPPPTLGFGVPATSAPHHFRVLIPRAARAPVLIQEHLGLQALGDAPMVLERATLERAHWQAIRGPLQRSFNASLKAHGLAPSAWQVGENLVERLLGRELCVLAWAIAPLAQERIAIAVGNWLALRPEERWWLFGMAAPAAESSMPLRGWQAALACALGEAAPGELHQAPAPKPTPTPKPARKAQESLALFQAD